MFKDKIDDITYGEVVKRVEAMEGESSGHGEFRISFLRNATVDLMIPYLKYLCYQEGLTPVIETGNYDSVLQDITGYISAPDHENSDLIVICLHPRQAARRLYSEFSTLSAEEIEAEIVTLLGYMEKVLVEARKRTGAPILLHNFEIPVYPAFGIFDYQHSNRQVNVIRSVNRRMVDIASRYDSVYILDMDLLQSRFGSRHLTDERYWHMARAPYSREGYLAIAKEYMKFIRSLRGKKKKCLVLDCDNTLWGGIVGEDGLGGIQIGQTYPGSAYREFQESILNLYNRGVLLALCSKNNPDDVDEVLEKHPDMILRNEHFVCKRVNWQDKATNIREIAAELDIGLDSLVFVDDNRFEVDMVREIVPEVTVLPLPEEPSGYRLALEENGFFDCVFFSDEDRKRSDMYRAEARRKEVRAQFTAESIEEYLEHLDMELYVGKAGDFHVPRIAQLTQRTNQFNLTTMRCAESRVRELIADDNADVYFVSLKDRFGDSGIVGSAMVLYDGENAFIDVFLLSCRVIGRGIEDVLLKVCVDEARQKGAENLFGTYIPTRKNVLVKDFYPGREFSRVEEEEGGKVIYVLPVSRSHMAFPKHFKLLKIGDVEYSKEEKSDD